MGVGHVQDARIAEAIEIVNAGAVGGARDARQPTRERSSTRELKEIAAADGHAMSPRLSIGSAQWHFQVEAGLRREKRQYKVQAAIEFSP
jgi:hypothetical protein